jgi:hypothetical protein
MNWTEIFNRLFAIINGKDEVYYSGPRFLSTVRELNPHYPDYSQLMEIRRRENKSTSRKDYFYDTLMSFDEPQRILIIKKILIEVESYEPEQCRELRRLLPSNGTAAPQAVEIDTDYWNSERLNHYIAGIDSALDESNYERVLTLCYTCLEGFLKAFINKHVTGYADRLEVLRMANAVKEYLRTNKSGYPDEFYNMITHVAHTVDRMRNNYSESHFGETSERLVSEYIRDLTNTEIRLLINLME